MQKKKKGKSRKKSPKTQKIYKKPNEFENHQKIFKKSENLKKH